MKVTAIGTGYVGLVTAACLSEMGNHVVCLDVDRDKIRTLNAGGIPIHEPGLQELVQRNTAAKRLQFTTDPAKAVEHGTILFIAVGTPPDQDGSADVQHVLSAARTIGRLMTDHKIVVNKSTVPVGTAEEVRAALQEELGSRGVHIDFSVVSNPEFLKEGAAIEDFMRPDRIIVGTDDERAALLMRALYAPFTRNRDRLILTDIRSAEFTKYAANAMLATRISFMNELALLAERVGVDIEMVRKGIGSDPRIGPQFLYPGVGYGGSCFPKDVKALMRCAQQHGLPLRVLSGVEAANEHQKGVVARFGDDLHGRRFAVWGLAFKPNTDDMREAPSRVIIADLLQRGASVVAYDPIAVRTAARLLGDAPGLEFAPSAGDALEAADALLIVTEWKEFKSPDFEHMRDSLRQPVVFDGRNLYEPELMAALGFEYHCIGRSAHPPNDQADPDSAFGWLPPFLGGRPSQVGTGPA
jgi:UDPglucose 6-dehydrogenase